MIYKVVIIFFFLVLPSVASKPSNYTLSTASFIYHSFPDTKRTEFFDNKLFLLDKTISKRLNLSIAAGTVINSYGNRCILLGVTKQWYQFSKNLVFNGTYLYSGEFFFPTFKPCGRTGIYKEIGEFLNTSFGFAPYLVHSIQYKVNDSFGISAGLILPKILLVRLQFYF